MKTIRLLYPDYLGGGGIETYWFGANLLSHILPENSSQPMFRVQIAPPDGRVQAVTQGMYARGEILDAVRSAAAILDAEQPDRVITVGGTCLTSLAPFDYLHGKYSRMGIIWIDAHADVSTPADGYPNAHAMVLGSLLGGGDAALAKLVHHGFFPAQDVLYIGLQGLLPYQEDFLKEAGVPFTVQDKAFVPEKDIRRFLAQFDHVLVHLDIDVLGPKFFHSTYFANPELTGDGSGGGRMTMDELGQTLDLISGTSDIAGLTLAEYLPFDEYRLHQLLCRLPILTSEPELL